MSVPSPLDQADGIVELRIDPRGTIAAPVLNATINGRGIRVPGIDDAGELDSTVAIDRRALTVESLDARLGPLRVNASGEYTWRGQIEGQFDANADDLATLASALDLADASLAGSAEPEGLAARHHPIAAGRRPTDRAERVGLRGRGWARDGARCDSTRAARTSTQTFPISRRE